MKGQNGTGIRLLKFFQSCIFGICVLFTAPPYYQTDSCIISLDLSLEEAPGISEDVGAILAVYGFI